MKKYCLTGFVVLAAIAGNAQAIKVPAGTTFTVTSGSTSTMSVSVMGQTIDNVTDINAIHEFTVKSVRPTGFTLGLVPKRVTGTITVLGQQQKFDTNDDSAMGSAGRISSAKVINQPQEVTVENGKVTSLSADFSNVLAAAGITDNGYGFAEFFLTRPDLKQGSSWTDSIATETVRFLNQYLVTSVTDQQVEIRVTTDTKVNGAMQQSGMEVKTSMKGFTTATRVYNKKTGMMISEKRAGEMTGTADAMGMNAPITIKTTALITLK